MIELLQLSVQYKASDLHLSANSPPLLRIDGELQQANLPILSHSEVAKLLYSLMTSSHRQQFENSLEVDFSFEIQSLARFRVHIFQQNKAVTGSIRIIPWTIKTLAELSLPAIIHNLCQLPHGLVLVTGPTGSGKSTTLTAMLDHINQSRKIHILTIEDPIEYKHTSKKALIHQQEVNRDTKSFNSALRAALRADPDIILIGELRDQESIRLALTASETGHLVFASLHTTSAAKSIHRIMDVFPGSEKNRVRTLLSESLQAILAQNLVRKIHQGRIAALEIMLCTPAIRHLIREDKIAQIYSSIQTNRQLGMQTLDQHLEELVKQHIIAPQTAYEIAINKKPFDQLK